jgi:opacity protein-like surface antigen
MRTMILLLTSSLAAGHAIAQESNWSGTYVGVSGGLAGLSPDSSASVSIQRAGRPDRIETGAYTIFGCPNGFGCPSDFAGELSSESTAALAVFAGTSFDQGGLVWGAEVKLEAAPIERAFEVGPIHFRPVIPGAGDNFPLPPGITPRPGGFTTVYQENETVAWNLQVDYSGVIRGKIGFPIGDALLISGHAGIAVTQAQLEVTQASEQLGGYFYRDIGNPNVELVDTLINASATSSTSAEETLVGIAVGALAEYQLTSNLIGRADVTYTKYGDISVANGPGSEVSIEPSTWSASVGLAWKL